MNNEEQMNSKPISKNRRHKTTQERLEDKLKQLEKATSSLELYQQRVKVLKEEILALEGKRQQEIMKEYGMNLSELEAFLANHKNELGGDA